MNTTIEKALGDEAKELLEHTCRGIPADSIHAPAPDHIEQILMPSDRPIPVLRSIHQIFSTGRLAGTGYLSILPVDQGVEHSAGSAFGPNPAYFDPENVVRLAIEAQCNAVASTLGVLGTVARRYAYKIPFILKLNHNEMLSYPNSYDQRLFASVKQAFAMGAAGVGATIYFGSRNSRRQIQEVSALFEHAHQLGMFTVLWCYLRSEERVLTEKNAHKSADLTGQANHLGVTIQADIIKQKMATNNGGFRTLDYGKTSQEMYDTLTTNHPIDLVRYQVANCYMGRIGMLNSGGPSGPNDLAQVVRAAVINKRAGGIGIISGRKAFQHPFKEGVKLLHAIQDVYLDKSITLA